MKLKQTFEPLRIYPHFGAAETGSLELLASEKIVRLDRFITFNRLISDLTEIAINAGSPRR